MIENKKYIIFDLEHTKIDSLFLADLKAVGYKLTHMSCDDKVDFGVEVTKVEELHEALNKVFHYKGHRKPQVIVVTDKQEMAEAAKELEITSVGVAFHAEDVIADFVANDEGVLRDLLIDDAKLQAMRVAAAMPKDGPTSTFVAGKDAKEKRPTSLAVVWKFLYPFLLFYFINIFATDASGRVVVFLTETSEIFKNFVIGTKDGVEYLTGNGRAVIQIPALLLTFLVVFFFVGGKKAVQETHKEATDFKGKDVLSWLALSVVLALGLNAVVSGFGMATLDVAYVETAEHMNSVMFPLGILLYAVLAPLTEELVFRGIIFNGLKGLVKPLSAAFISSFLFGVYHGNTIQLVYGFVMSFVFAYAYHSTGRFIVPVLLHSLVNLFVFLLGKCGLWQANVALGIVGVVAIALSAGALYLTISRREKIE